MWIVPAAVVSSRAAAQRIRQVGVYQSATALAEVNPNDVLEDASEVYFQQSPFPRNFMVGTQIAVAQPSLIFGRAAGDPADIASLGAGVTLTLDGNSLTADFASVTTLAQAATALATAINAHASYAGVTVTVVDGAFAIQGATDSDFGEGFAPGTPAVLGLAGTGVLVLANLATETVAEALTRFEMLDCSFTWIGLNPTASADLDTVLGVANWTAARPQYGFGFDVFGDDVLTPAETTSIGARVSALKQDNVFAIYNGDAIDFKALSLMARFSSINFNGRNTLITAKFQTLPGTTATNLSTAQKQELERKRINHYTPVGNGADLAQGQSFGDVDRRGLFR